MGSKTGDHLWKEGQSGNPAGKPVGTRSVETLFREAIKKLGDDHKIEDVERDLIISILAKARKGDMKAMEMYLDRLYGKPKQSIDNKHSGSVAISSIDIH